MRISIVIMSLLFLGTYSLDGLSQTVGGISGTTPATSSVSPASPTSDDFVTFNLTTDGQTYSNQCVQLSAFGGTQFEVIVDESSRTIRIGVTGNHSGGCLAIYDPVNGITGSIGTLAAGDWEIQASFPGNPPLIDPFQDSFSFTVEQAPDPVLIGDVNRDGVVNFFDLFPFIGVLFSRTYQVEADTDQNGVVNFLDIAGLIMFFPGR